MLYERKQNGSLAFPELENIELRYGYSPSGDNNPQLQYNLLQTIRTRAQDPTVRRISVLRINDLLVKNLQFKEELERCVPSLVIFKFNGAHDYM